MLLECTPSSAKILLIVAELRLPDKQLLRVAE